MAKMDFLFSIVLLALGLFIVQQSYAMPTYVHLGAHLLTSPGLTPGILGVILVILGAILFHRSGQALGWSLSVPRDVDDPEEMRAGRNRFLLAAFLTLGFAGGMVGNVPFAPSVMVFVFLFVFLFEWPLCESRAQKIRMTAIAAALAVAVGLIVPYIFVEIFLVRLP